MDHVEKTKKEYEKFKETGGSRYSYQNELDKACFQLDMCYGDFKNLPERTICEKLLRDKALNIAKNPKYDGYQRGLASMVYKFFDRNSSSMRAVSKTLATRDKSASGGAANRKVMSN